MRSLLHVVVAAAAALLIQGCASTHFGNQPLAAGQNNPERRVVEAPQDRPLILLAISGGGSRAAALGWSVLRELRDYRYPLPDGSTRPLIDDIAVVSSVSGGSVIAAHFALYGPQGLDRFEPDFLAPDNTKALALDAASPVTWLSLAFTGASRSELVEQLFDRQLFNGKTFADLNQPGKPYLIMNATDMAGGEVFAFTPHRFDDICSNLDVQPISSGVASSAAVPIVFTPVALENHSAKYCADKPPPAWVTSRLTRLYAPYVNPDSFRLARYANDLRHGPGSFRKIDYLYLLDGGLADNLAIHGLMEAMSSPYAAPVVAQAGGQPGTLINAISTGQLKKVVVIVVNARADPPNTVYQSPKRPGIVGMIDSVVSVPINSTSSAVNGQIDMLTDELKTAGGDNGGGPGAPLSKGLRVYNIAVDFDQLRTNDPIQRELRDQAKQIPTLWTISKPNLDVIDKAATTLLRQHPCFQLLLTDVKANAKEPVDPDYARTGCPQVSDRGGVAAQ